MTRFKQLFLIVVCMMTFTSLGSSSISAATQSIPKGWYATHLPSSAKGTWIERFHGGYFAIRITKGKYAYRTSKQGKSKDTIQTIVTKTKGLKKNQFNLYTDFADPFVVRWAHHHLYYFGNNSENDWVRMNKVSK